MLKPDQGLALKLLKLSVSSDDFQETLQLKKQIKKALQEREVPYLSAVEFDQILRWKLDKQYHRSKQQREINVDEVVVPITRAFIYEEFVSDLSICDALIDAYKEDEFKIPGVLSGQIIDTTIKKSTDCSLQDTEHLLWLYQQSLS